MELDRAECRKVNGEYTILVDGYQLYAPWSEPGKSPIEVLIEWASGERWRMSRDQIAHDDDSAVWVGYLTEGDRNACDIRAIRRHAKASPPPYSVVDIIDRRINGRAISGGMQRWLDGVNIMPSDLLGMHLKNYKPTR